MRSSVVSARLDDALVDDVSVGALGDSFYEYLLKSWVYDGGRNGRRGPSRSAFDKAAEVSQSGRHRFVHRGRPCRSILCLNHSPLA